MLARQPMALGEQQQLEQHHRRLPAPGGRRHRDAPMLYPKTPQGPYPQGLPELTTVPHEHGFSRGNWYPVLPYRGTAFEVVHRTARTASDAHGTHPVCGCLRRGGGGQHLFLFFHGGPCCLRRQGLADVPGADPVALPPDGVPIRAVSLASGTPAAAPLSASDILLAIVDARAPLHEGVLHDRLASRSGLRDRRRRVLTPRRALHKVRAGVAISRERLPVPAPIRGLRGHPSLPA